MEASSTVVSVQRPGTSLQHLPAELLIQIASESAQSIRDDPRLLTLCKRWYTVAFPIFARELALSDIALYRHMDCKCCLVSTLLKAAPHVECFRFKQHLHRQTDFDRLCKRYESPEIAADSEEDLPFSDRLQTLTPCQIRKLVRNMMPMPISSAIQAIVTRTRRLLQFARKFPKLTQVDIALDKFDYRGPKPSDYYSDLGSISVLERFLELQHLTSLRLCLDGHHHLLARGLHRTKVPGHICTIVADQMQSLKHLFLSMDTVCPDILKWALENKVSPIEDLTISLVPSRSNSHLSLANFVTLPDGEAEWSGSIPECLRDDLLELCNQMPKARRLQVAGVEAYSIEQDDRDHDSIEQYSTDFFLFDAISRLMYLKEFVEVPTDIICDTIWGFLDEQSPSPAGGNQVPEGFWDQIFRDEEYDGRRIFDGPR